MEGFNPEPSLTVGLTPRQHNYQTRPAIQRAKWRFCSGFLRFLIQRPCLKQLQAGFFVVQFEFFTMQFEFFTMQIEPFTVRLEFYALQIGPSFVTRDR